MAIVFGLLLRNLITLPQWLQPGIQFALKRILKLGIILLGIRLSLSDVVEVGVRGIPVIVFCILGALVGARWLSKRLALSPRLGTLIAVGTSICGATAIVATGPSIDAKEEEMTYAIANITIFGIAAMFLYPYIANGLFAEDSLNAGLFLGTAIHETAQVAGSGLIYSQVFDSEEVLNIATVAKLVRNVFMIAVIPIMAYLHRKANDTTETQGKPHLKNLFPVFILGFLLMAFVRTIGDTTLSEDGKAWWVISADHWQQLTHTLKGWAEILLAVAMAGVGLGTGLRQLRNLGIKPFYVGFAASISVAGLSLAAIAVLS